MRKMIRNLLNKAGYDLVKVNVHDESKANQISKVKVGNYFIDMPGNNVQISTYKYRPDANDLLGTLSLCVAKKYPGLSVIDIGANVGDTVAVIKTAIDVPVIGIEGDNVSYQFLERNTKQFENVLILKQFLGDKKQTLQVELEKSGWNTTLIPTEGKGQELTLLTLDEVLEQQKLSSREIKVLKVDCEGFDTIILRGATGLIQSQKPAIFFEYNKTSMEAIHEDGLSTLLSLEKCGYRSVLFFDNYGRYMLTAPINDHALIKQLHNYSEDGVSQVGYYDVCLFHESDGDIEKEFTSIVTRA
jgi:FkbM family methyltransferase